MNSLIAVLFLAAAASSIQDQSPAASVPAACGPAGVQFEVKTDKAQPPTAPPEADQALVVVVENLRAGCFMCDTTIKLGLDGSWMAATKGNSYASFPVAPGDHHLCAALQVSPAGPDHVALSGFTAEAGRIYYFRARLTDRNNSGKGGVEWALDLDPIHADQGQYLAASYPHSVAQRRKPTSGDHGIR